MTTATAAITTIPLTMSSREIAELTGKRHDNVVRDIEKMLNDVGMGLLNFEDTYINPQNGQEYRCYKLPKNLTLNLIAGYRADMRLKIIDRWMELEASQSSEIRTKPKRIRKPAFDVAFERCLRVTAHIPGMDENQRLLMAARGTKELSGVNPLELMGITSMEAPTQDNYLTPTEIGKQIGLSAIATNKLITAIGYQVKAVGSSVSSDYVMTEAGGKYGRMFDTTRRHGKGSQQQLKWSPDLVGILRTAMIAGENTKAPFAKKPETEAV